MSKTELKPESKYGSKDQFQWPLIKTINKTLQLQFTTRIENPIHGHCFARLRIIEEVCGIPETGCVKIVLTKPFPDGIKVTQGFVLMQNREILLSVDCTKNHNFFGVDDQMDAIASLDLTNHVKIELCDSFISTD